MPPKQWQPYLHLCAVVKGDRGEEALERALQDSDLRPARQERPLPDLLRPDQSSRIASAPELGDDWIGDPERLVPSMNDRGDADRPVHRTEALPRPNGDEEIAREVGLQHRDLPASMAHKPEEVQIEAVIALLL